MKVSINFEYKQEINDCPFCGSDEISLIYKGGDYEGIHDMRVCCSSCNVEGPLALGEDYDEEIHGDSFESYMAEEAILLWNIINIKK